jgi:DNA ligase-1
MKHKPPRIDLDVVITSAKYGDGKRRNVFGSFGISVKDDSTPTGFTPIGSVGTGLSEGDLVYLTTELKKIVEKYDAETFHVLPRIVLEITCDLISRDSDGNYGLRFPRVLRIRQDKYAKECNSMLDVQMIA